MGCSMIFIHFHSCIAGIPSIVDFHSSGNCDLLSDDDYQVLLTFDEELSAGLLPQKRAFVFENLESSDRIRVSVRREMGFPFAVLSYSSPREIGREFDWELKGGLLISIP